MEKEITREKNDVILQDADGQHLTEAAETILSQVVGGVSGLEATAATIGAGYAGAAVGALAGYVINGHKDTKGALPGGVAGGVAGVAVVGPIMARRVGTPLPSAQTVGEHAIEMQSLREAPHG